MSTLLTRSPNRFRSRTSFTAAAAVAAIAAPAIAEAQIVYSGVLNTTAAPTVIDLNADVAGTNFTFRPNKKGDPHSLRATSFSSAQLDFTPVSFGDVIDGDLSYSTTGPSLGNVTNELGSADGSSYYYAFSYSSAGDTLYGWLYYTSNYSGTALSVTLHGWAYNSIPGQSLTAGQTVSAVPEPATYGVLLGIAMLGMAWVRRRRCRTSHAA